MIDLFMSDLKYCWENIGEVFKAWYNLARTMAQVFSLEFCEISKNTFFTEHHLATASLILRIQKWNGNAA